MRHPFESRLTRGPAPLSTVVVAGDPDEDARLILASGLTYAGYRVRLAGTGDELLREARALSSGADRFLTNPTHLSRLFDIVASIHVPPPRGLETTSRG